MRFFAILFLSLFVASVTGCAAVPQYRIIKKGDVAGFTGWHLTDDEFSGVLKRAESCGVDK